MAYTYAGIWDQGGHSCGTVVRLAKSSLCSKEPTVVTVPHKDDLMFTDPQR